MNAVLLIGGLGTRLRPLTLTTPKPLLPVLGRPFLAYQIEMLKTNGITEIVLCTAYKPEAFKRVFDNGERYGVHLNYVHEDTPRGTGGAIKNAEAWAEKETLIFNGDILMDLDIKGLLSFHRERKAALTIALTTVENPSAYGLIETDGQGRISRFLEKPKPEEVTCHTINAGAYIFSREIFAQIPPASVVSVERDIFPRLLANGFPCYGLLSDGYWLDLGTIEKYAQAHKDILLGKHKGIAPERIIQEMVGRY
jgi:mannose-1-phosphate guanylyltransferase